MDYDSIALNQLGDLAILIKLQPVTGWLPTPEIGGSGGESFPLTHNGESPFICPVLCVAALRW